MLSRDEVRNKFKSWGIEDPTEEQVSDYLAQIGKEVKSSEDKALRYKGEADRVKELEKQLDELNSANLSEVEKANKATEDALKEVESLKKTVTQMQLQKSLAEIGIVGEDADSLVTEEGLNTAKLGEILAAREKNAVAAFQKKALDETPSPTGAKENPEPDKPYKDIVERVSASKKAETEAVNIIDSYK